MAQYDFITAEEFNALKDRVIKECSRRTKEANSYNQDPITPPAIKTVEQIEEIKAKETSQILETLNKFNVFPGVDLMDVSYEDGCVIIGDYIFPYDGLSNIIAQLEQEPRKNNDDCRSGCMGLCTNGCNEQCTGCTGCSSCSGSCDGWCQDGCLNGCGGCTGACGGNCTGCSGYCGSGSQICYCAPYGSGGITVK